MGGIAAMTVLMVRRYERGTVCQIVSYVTGTACERLLIVTT